MTIGIRLHFVGFVMTLASAHAWADVTIRVSVGSTGIQANGSSRGKPSISGDGRFVAFASAATNLVALDTNGADDVFVHDLHTGQTTRVSTSSTGAAGNADSFRPSLSADGRFVAFASLADNLVPDDSNGEVDIFVHDRLAGETTRVSVTSSGEASDGHSQQPAISADGRYVVFASNGKNFDPRLVTFWTLEIFVHDRVTGQTEWVSKNLDGTESNSYEPTVSSDGRYVVFDSTSPNLVANDTNSVRDIFLHDRQTGQTSRANISTGGEQANSFSGRAALASGGRHVVFESYASNLVADDLNDEWDIFVRDLAANQTLRVNVGPGGVEANQLTSESAISADGRYVAFASLATNLIPGGHAWYDDTYLHDLATQVTSLITYPYTGSHVNHFSEHPAVSDNGRYVVFVTDADNVILNDSNATYDVFVRDRALPGDPNADGHVDLVDFAELAECLTGASAGPLAFGCDAFDRDADGDVDLRDVARFQTAFTGPPAGSP